MTGAPAFSLSPVGPESDRLLRNLFEHYIHDMAPWFDLDTTADGSYSYDTAPLWSSGSSVYIARAGEAIAAPAAPWLPGPAAFDVREFFVIRRYRRRGFGRLMAARLWDLHPGQWLVRVLSANAGAVLFWRAAVRDCSRGQFTEEPHILNGREWRFFRFTHRRNSPA